MKIIELCNRCGACCSWMDRGVLITCKHLKRVSKVKTYCRVFKNPDRVGLKISGAGGIHVTCQPRSAEVQGNLKDCPYNCEQEPKDI